MACRVRAEFRVPGARGRDCEEDLHNLWSSRGEGRHVDQPNGHPCPECGAPRHADHTPTCACARRAADALRDTRTAEAAAAEDFDPLRIRPYVDLPGTSPDATTPDGSPRATKGTPSASGTPRATAQGARRRTRPRALGSTPPRALGRTPDPRTLPRTADPPTPARGRLGRRRRRAGLRARQRPLGRTPKPRTRPRTADPPTSARRPRTGRDRRKAGRPTRGRPRPRIGGRRRLRSGTRGRGHPTPR